jgi:hypothetical protein
MEGLRWIRRTGENSARTRPQSSLGAKLLPLRGPERRLANALDQLRSGVPLNWTQVEDDPELATLSYLEDVASECRGRVLGETPTSLREDILGDLSKRLPKPKPVAVKVVPKTLAGFSENVPVMTQTEDNIPQLISRAPQIAGAIALAAGVIALLYWGIGMLLARPPAGMPTFSWIEVRQGGKAVSLTQRPSDWLKPSCQSYDLTDPAAKRDYISIPDIQQLQRLIGFPISYLPRTLSASDSLTSTATYATNLSGLSMASCEETFNPNDRGAIVKIDYTVNRSATRNDPNRGTTIAPLSVFQARQLPITLDVGAGTWKEVTVGGAHGVYWRGGPYHDLSDNTWIGDVSVMMVERGDSVLVLVGQASTGINEELLTQAMSSIDAERRGEENLKSPPFSWIGVWRGSQLLIGNNLPAGWNPPVCDAEQSSLYYPSTNLEITQARVGYPVMTLPETVPGPDMLVQRVPDDLRASPPAGEVARISVTLPTTYTLRLADIGVASCNKESADPGARIKMRYILRFETPPLIEDGAMRDIPVWPANTGPANIVAFEAWQTPIKFYVEGGQWKEVKVGEARGLYWSGNQYHDMEGTLWSNNTNVLVVERGDMVLTLISSSAPESVLLAAAEALH